MTKAERAIKALREAADALDACPVRMLNRFLPVIQVNNSDLMRQEADYIENYIATADLANRED